MHFLIFSFIFVKCKVSAGAVKLVNHNLDSFIRSYPPIEQVFVGCWLYARYDVKV